MLANKRLAALVLLWDQRLAGCACKSCWQPVLLHPAALTSMDCMHLQLWLWPLCCCVPCLDTGICPNLARCDAWLAKPHLKLIAMVCGYCTAVRAMADGYVDVMPTHLLVAATPEEW